jgi:hypothetical protein
MCVFKNHAFIYFLRPPSWSGTLTLCMLASWSHEGVVFLDFLPSSHSITSSLLLCLGPTDAPCPRIWDPTPPFPNMASPFTGSAHTPLPGSGTTTLATGTASPATENSYKNPVTSYKKNSTSPWTTVKVKSIVTCTLSNLVSCRNSSN